jgi:hypothetical protein
MFATFGRATMSLIRAESSTSAPITRYGRLLQPGNGRFHHVADPVVPTAVSVAHPNFELEWQRKRFFADLRGRQRMRPWSRTC